MPRYNEHGQITNAKSIWLAGGRKVTQVCHENGCSMQDQFGNVILPRGANTWVGGGNILAIFEHHPDGVHDTHKRHFPGAHIGDLATCRARHDGAYALKVNYHSFGPWDVIEPDSSRWRLTDGDAKFIQLLNNKDAIWLEGEWLAHTPGMKVRHPNRRIWWPVAVKVNDEYFILGQDQGTSELVLDGFVIGPASPQYFYPDIRYDGTHFHVCHALDQGDQFIVELPPFTLAELQQKPRVGSIKPEPEPEPEPEPDKENPVGERWKVIAPNPKEYVEKIRRAFPEDWTSMNDHRNSPTFNMRLASYLHFGYRPLEIPGNPAWGLNGKRGTDELSPDVLNYRNPEAPFGTESYDYVVGHGGGSSATVGWQDVTRDSEGYDASGHKHDQPGAGAKWIQPPKPSELGGGIVIPDPGTEPDPKPGDSSTLRAEIEALKKQMKDFIKVGDTITLQTKEEHHLTAPNNGNDGSIVPRYPWDERGHAPGDWEAWKVGRLD